MPRSIGGLERREIDAVIPTKAEPIRARADAPVPLRRAARLREMSARQESCGPNGPPQARPVLRLRVPGTAGVALSVLSVEGRANKAVVIGHDYPALLRARRRRDRWGDEDPALPAPPLALGRLPRRGEDMARPRARRAARPANMRIQAFLTAAAINLKRLAAAFYAFIAAAIVLTASLSIRNREARWHQTSPTRLAA